MRRNGGQLHERSLPRRRWRRGGHPRRREVREVTGEDGPPRQLQGQGRNQGKEGKIPYGEIRTSSDESHQEETCRGDVAIRGAQEVV